jgi:hypothetical protein
LLCVLREKVLEILRNVNFCYRDVEDVWYLKIVYLRIQQTKLGQGRCIHKEIYLQGKEKTVNTTIRKWNGLTQRSEVYSTR